MATSGALSTSNQYVKYKITVTQNSQNVTANTSNVTVSVRFYRTNTGYTTYGSGTVYCKINGTTYTASVTPDQKITSSGIVLFTKTLNINHNTDGSKTLATSAWISMNTPLTSSEQSYNQALTTIARATTPTISVSTVYFGGSITISMPRASSSFTHTLRYSIGNSTGVIGSGLGTSTTWTVPLSLASNLPNATIGILTISCETYNGSSRIGTQTATVTVTIPSTVKPSITDISTTEAVSGISAKFGEFIQNQSRITVNITASGSYSSSIISYISRVCGKTYNGSSFTVEAVNLCETVTISTTVTDSRGQTATLNKTITVLHYDYPIINRLRAYRCDSDGTLNDEGNYISMSYKYTITPLNNLNDKSYTLSYKKSGETTYINLQTENVYSKDTTIVPATVFNVDYAYIIRIEVSDYFKSVAYEIEVPTAFTLVDYHSSGKGIAFGKVSESPNLFDEGLPAIFRSSALLAGGFTHNIPVINQDLDTVNVSGVYYIGNGSINRPVAINGYLEVFTYTVADGVLYQRYTTYYGTVYDRVQIYGAWSTWCGNYTSGIWTYETNLNGELSCYAKIPISNLSITTSLASWYRSAVIAGSNYSYPVEFETIPAVGVNYLTSNGYGGIVWETTPGTTTTPPDFYIIRPNSASGASGYIDIQVKGKWK